MAKIKCPGCGAEVDTESGQAEFIPPAAEERDEPAVSDDAAGDARAEGEKPSARKPSRFWLRDND